LYLVVNDLDVIAKCFKGRNDHPVLKGLRDEDDVLAKNGLEGVRVEPEVLEGRQGGEVLQHADHALQAWVGWPNPDAGKFLLRMRLMLKI
jgi:hypothetical protein